MTLSPTLYYLADRHDRFRLMADGSIQPSNDGTPWYFGSEDAAKAHDEAYGLTVFSVPTAETIPGAPKGTRIEDAIDANDVYLSISAAVVEEVAKLCRR